MGKADIEWRCEQSPLLTQSGNGAIDFERDWTAHMGEWLRKAPLTLIKAGAGPRAQYSRL